MGWVESCDATQGNAFGSLQVRLCHIVRAPREKHLGGLGQVGSCQVMSCEAAQGNVFGWVRSGWVGSCEGGYIKNAKL